MYSSLSCWILSWCLLFLGVLGWLLVVVFLPPPGEGPKEDAASTYLVLIFMRIAGGIPWVLRSTAVRMQLPHQCITDVGRGGLKQPEIECLTIRSLMCYEWRYPQLLLLWELSDSDSRAVFWTIKWISGRLAMSGGKSRGVNHVIIHLINGLHCFFIILQCHLTDN